MISRIVTMTALMAGTALLCLPVQAQTGTPAPSTINAPAGSVGTPGSPGMSSGQSTMGTGNMAAPANADSGMNHAPKYQAQAHAHPSGRMRGGNMAERQMTDCLNNAAAQNQPLDSCKR